MFNRYSLLFTSILISLISGCGEDNSDNSHDQVGKKEHIAVYASDVLQFVNIGSTYNVIDLYDKTKTEDDSPLIISDVSPLNNKDDCQVIDINGLSFTVSANDLGSCNYKYKVKSAGKDKEGSSEAIVNITTTSDTTKGEYLKPISEVIEHSTDTEEKKLTLDLTLMSLPDGFNLIQESLLLLGDEVIAGDPGSVTYQSPNTIVYKSPQQEGMVRIYYSAMNDQGDVRPGIIFIAVGQLSNNHNPTADSGFLLSEDGDDFYISIKKKYLIDLEKEGLVKDDDGDSLQIVALSSFNNRIEYIPGEPLKFYYIPMTYGEAEIHYTVTDHNGGYAMGTLLLMNQEYKSIEYLGKRFSGPLTLKEVESMGGSFSSSYIENGISGDVGVVQPAFTAELAESYCNIRGFTTVANSEDLTAVWNDVLDKENVYLSEYKWHAGLPYWIYSSKDNTYNLMSLYDGKVYTSSDYINGYFSCEGDFNVNSVVIVPGDLSISWNESKTFTLLNENAGRPIHRVKWTATSNDMPDEASFEMEGGLLVVSAPKEVAEDIGINAHITVIGEDLDSGLSSEVEVLVGFGQCPEGVAWQDSLTSPCIHTEDVETSDVVYTFPPSRTVMDLFSAEMVDIDKISYVGSPITVPRVERLSNTSFINLYSSYCNVLNRVNFLDRNNWEVFLATNSATANDIVNELNSDLSHWLPVRGYFEKILTAADADLTMPEDVPDESTDHPAIYMGNVSGKRMWKTTPYLAIAYGKYADFICRSEKN
ncbi:TPA: hypothetical protein ACX6PX_003859 [Photobacterium damselae]